jgi:TolB protein
MGWSARGDSLLITDASGHAELFSSSRAGEPTIVSAKAGLGAVEVGYSGYNDRAAHVFRPPNGDEMLFVSQNAGTKLVAVKPDGTGLRTLLDLKSPLKYGNLRAPQWSPDGSKIVVMVEFPGPEQWHLYVMNADGTDVHPLSPLTTDSQADQGSPMWSPDGTRIAFQYWIHHTADDGEDFNPIGVVDVATGVLHDVGPTVTNGFVSWEWSPDGKSILEVPGDGSGHVLIVDAATGASKAAPWVVNFPLSWQRTAP